MVFTELIFNIFYLCDGVVVLKVLNFKGFYFVMLVLNIFYLGRVWWS